MHKGRLEAFSDAVIAIILTIMVLELRPPLGVDFASLKPLATTFAAYILSFVNLGIYWNNHHHMLQAVKQVSGGVLWANMHLMFWLTLVPFSTAWMGESNLACFPVVAYGVVLMMAGAAYYILTLTLIKANGKDSPVALAIGKDFKGKISVVIYLIGIGVAFLSPPVSCALYLAVALMWLVPDRRFEPA